MESRFSHNFSSVRVHTDARAAESADALGARAYTAGEHVVFGRLRYDPHSAGGRWLLAHELAHTIQQRATESTPMATRPLVLGAATDRFERESDRAADAVVRGSQVTRDSLSTLPDAPAAVQRATGDELTGKSPAPATTESGGGGPAELKFDFHAFIPGTLGKPFGSYDHPTDLANQTAFDTALAAVPGTWLPEPGSFGWWGNGPWYYATDNRSWGGGSRRIGFSGSVKRSQIGAMAGAGPFFKHDTSGSEHVRWQHTGVISSSGETGSVDGPYSKSASPTSSEEHVDSSANESKIVTSGAAAYPFNALSPNIDYTVILVLGREPSVGLFITHNLFPYYELLLNGRSVWSYKSESEGPGVINLNRSRIEAKTLPLE